ncbi:MAG: hypothetical protein ACREC9_15060 [Methylocella sp.]
MSESPRLVQLGSVGASLVLADVRNLGSAVPATPVTLTADYAMISPPGYPSRPSFTGDAAASLQFARTVPKGTVISVLAPEAAALKPLAGAAAFPSLNFSDEFNSQYLAIGLGA